MGMMQTAVLGSLGSAGNSITGKGILPVATRLMTRTATGIAEQHLMIEPAAQLISQLLPEAYRLNMGDGLLSNAFKGKWGDAWRQLAVSAVTFAAFSGLHEAQHGAPGARETLDALKGVAKHMADSGIPHEQIAARIEDIDRWVMEGHATAEINAMPPSPLKDYAAAMNAQVQLVRQEQAAQAKKDNPGLVGSPQETGPKGGQETGPSGTQAQPDINLPPAPPGPPGAPPGPPQAPQGPTVAPTLPAAPQVAPGPRVPERVASTFREQFPGARETVRDGKAVLTADMGGGKEAWITHTPASEGRPEAVRIDFDSPKVGSRDFATFFGKIKGLIANLKGSGADIEFRAIARETGLKADRAKTYAKVLEKAGYELVEKGPGGEYRYREKLAKSPEWQAEFDRLVKSGMSERNAKVFADASFPDEPTTPETSGPGARQEPGGVPAGTEPAPQGTSVEAPPETPPVQPPGGNGEGPPALPEAVTPPGHQTPPNTMGIRERLEYEASPEGKAWAADRAKFLSRKASEGTETPLEATETILTRARDAKLPERQLQRIEAFLNGKSFAEIGAAEGVSRAAIHKDVKAALAKLGETTSLKQRQLIDRASEAAAKHERLEGMGTEMGDLPNRPLSDAEALEPDHAAAIDAVVDLLKRGDDLGPISHEDVVKYDSNSNELIDLLGRAKAGANLDAMVLKKFPELARLTPGEREALIQLAKEEYDATKSGDEPTSLHPVVSRILQEAARNAPPDVKNQGGQELQGTEAGPRPAQAPGDAAPNGQAPPPAPAGPRPGEAGGDIVEPAGHNPVLNFAKKLVSGVAEGIRDDGGYLDLDQFKAGVQHVYAKFKDTVSHVHDNLKDFAGSIFPRMGKLSEKTATAGAQVISVRQFAHDFSARVIDKITGGKLTPEENKLYGTALDEMRLRQISKYYGEEATRLWAEAQRYQSDPKTYKRLIAESAVMSNAEMKVGSFVGAPNSALAHEVAYQDAISSPRMQDILAKWKAHLTDPLDEMFRVSKGMNPGDPLPEGTQIPGISMSLKSIDPEAPERPPGAVQTVGAGRGNLRSPKIGKAGHLNLATGSGVYETDLTSIIEHSIGTHAGYAAKQNFYRTAEKEGVGKWGPAGKREEGWTEFKDINPARGTQANKEGETSFYVRDEAAGEFREALAPDMPTRFKTIAGINGVLNTATLMSTVEAVYHSKNLLTMLMNPKVSIAKLIDNGWKIWSKDSATLDRLVELTRQGVSVPAEREVRNSLGSKYNPLTWMGKGLHFLRKAMVLTADHAYSELLKDPRADVKDTESNRRNFINQLGQYNIKGQNKLVQLLRDTGFGPFATAGTNYWVQGIRSLTGNPGLETNSVKGQAYLRAWKMGKIASVLGTVAAMNYLLHKRVDGDDNTPIGAVKIGTDANGKTQYLDLVALTGLTRGMRETGLLALAEGVRHERPAGAIADQSVHDALHSVLHPAMGPPVQFAHTLFTGENSFGTRIAPRHAESQAGANAMAALRNINPLVSSLGGYDRPPESQPKSASERAWSLLGPYGVKSKGALSRWQEAMHDLTERRTLALATPGQRFEDEGRYRRLNHIAHTIQQLKKRLSSASGEERAVIQSQMNRLAAAVLEH